jgi:vacuolar protein sorting-associated protein 13A/C
MSTAHVIVVLRPKTIRVSGRLGSLSLENESEDFVVRPEFSHILSIEGENFADFNYQTFDPEEDAYTGVNSSVSLDAASLRMNFLEEPLHDIYLFLVKLGQLKGLYDSAREAAVQKASDMDHMQFHISVKSPILVVPTNPATSKNTLILRLGEIHAQNTAAIPSDIISASLRGIQLTSQLYYDAGPALLKIIDNTDITADITQTSGINRAHDRTSPESKVCASKNTSNLFF